MTRLDDSSQSDDLGRLIQKLDSLAQAINRLAETNQSLVDTMVDIVAEDREEGEPAQYMDGTPR